MNPLPLLFAASAATLEKREQLAMEWQGRVTHFIDAHGSQLIGAAGIAFAGFVAAHYAGKLAAAWLANRSMEPPVRMLIERVVRLRRKRHRLKPKGLVFGGGVIVCRNERGAWSQGQRKCNERHPHNPNCRA